MDAETDTKLALGDIDAETDTPLAALGDINAETDTKLAAYFAQRHDVDPKKLRNRVHCNFWKKEFSMKIKAGSSDEEAKSAAAEQSVRAMQKWDDLFSKGEEVIE